MATEKLRALIAPLSEVDRQMLREILDEMLAQEDEALEASSKENIEKEHDDRASFWRQLDTD